MASAATRVDREDVLLELTRSICPLCKRVTDAEVSAREGRVILRKRCPAHGEFEAHVYSDADAYVAHQRFKPGTIPLALQTDTHDGCPLDCGICPAHKQHTCLGIIEVNSACNLDCPLCFADSGRHHPDQFSLTREQVARMLDAVVEAAGEPEVIQISGGEPTIHPEILEFVGMARERGIRIVMVNTNGIRLARPRLRPGAGPPGRPRISPVRRGGKGHAPRAPRARPARHQDTRAEALRGCGPGGDPGRGGKARNQ
jgi:uncharacterized radical SAM superfamily Fe-S cluster-containing enzyme